MKLVVKLDENGNVVMVADGKDKGKIVYTDSDDEDKEYLLDPATMYTKIINLGAENKTHRDNAKTAKEALKPFEGVEGLDLENPSEWIESATTALATVKNYDDKQLVDAGKVDEVKKEMREAYEAQLANKDEALRLVTEKHTGELGNKDTQIRTLMVSNRFSTSPYFTGKDSTTLFPPDAAEALFGKHFSVEDKDGKLTLKATMDDSEIMSQRNPGDPAGFEEAIGIILEKYPNKDNIMRASQGGSGGQGGGDGNQNPTDELSKLKAQFSEAEKAGNAQLMITLKNNITKLQAKM